MYNYFSDKLHNFTEKCFKKSMVTDVRHAAMISPGSGQAVVTGAGKAVVTSAGKAAVTGAEQAVVTNDRQAALHQLVDYNVVKSIRYSKSTSILIACM